jgi:heptosyltransferase II
MALPAVAAIRDGRPGDALIVAGRASTVPLFSMVRGVDEVVELDSRGGLLGAISWAEDAAALRSAHGGVAILLPNSFRSAWTVHRAGIPERWGYAADLRRRLLTRAVPKLRRTPTPVTSPVVVSFGSSRMSRAQFHQAEYYLHLVEALGVARRRPGLPSLPTLAAPPEAHERAAQLLARHDVPGDAVLVGLAPGAAYGKAKQWPPDRYAELAAALHQRLGVVCLIFGARADQPTARAVSRMVGERLQSGKAKQAGSQAKPASGQAPAVLDLAGQTDLPLLVALMTRCRSVVCNDSGAMHVAAAAGVPVAAVFGASDERGTAPLPSDAPGVAAHEILTASAWCRPCMLRECPIDHRCMRRVGAAQVAAAVERQVRR